jgi:hypothetical protein
MTGKLSSRQQAQLAWLETLPRKYERLFRTVELLAVNQADEAQLRSMQRLLEELKSQASQLGLGALGDGFGIMATMLRRPGGHQVKVRGLRELLAGVKINLDGALRAASTPEVEPEATNGPSAP